MSPFPLPSMYGDWRQWAGALVQMLSRTATTAVQAPAFPVSRLPSAAGAGQIIYVPDETGGAVLAFSDGTNWRRVTDRAVVS